MISKEEFISWIEKEIMPQLKEVENTKLKWLLLFKHNIIKMTIISVILFIFGVIFEILVCILPFCFLLILCLLGLWQAKIYQKKSKKRFLSPILSKFNLRPISSKEIPCDGISDLADHGLFSGYSSSVKVDDCFCSTDSKYPFYMQEVSIGTSKNTIFQGLVVCFCLDKSYQAETLILSKFKIMGKYISPPLPTIGKATNLKEMIFDAIKKSQSSIDVEDIEFNKQFSVYTSDQVESRAILTPAIIERLKKIRSFSQDLTYNPDMEGKKEWHDCPVDALFKGNNIILTINSHRNMFEFFNLANVFFHKKIEDNKEGIINIKDFENFYDEVSALFEFQELLKLK